MKTTDEYILTLQEHAPILRERSCSLDEFSDMMARDLGKRYGLNDIREAR